MHEGGGVSIKRHVPVLGKRFLGSTRCWRCLLTTIGRQLVDWLPPFSSGAAGLSAFDWKRRAP